VPELIGKLGYDGRGFSSGLNQAVGEAKQAGAKISGYFESAFTGGPAGLLGGVAGAFGLQKAFGVIAEAAKSVKEQFAEARAAAREMQVDIGLAERLGNVTRATGSGPEAVAVAMDHIAESLEKIRHGEPGFEKLIDDFRQLGVSISDIQNGTRQSVALKILAGLEGQGNVSDATVAAMRNVMGRGGPGLIPAGQIGLNSFIANAGNLSEDQQAALAHSAAIDKVAAANRRSLMNRIGTGVNLLYDKVRQFIPFGGASLEDTYSHEQYKQSAAASNRARAQEAARETADAEAEEYKNRITKEKQRKADLETAAEHRKEADKIRAEAEQAEMDNALAGKSPSERRQMLRDRLEAARMEEKRNRELASLEAPGSAAGERFLRDAEANRLAGLRIGHSLIESAQRGGGGAGAFDSLARIGGFTQNADVGLDLQERIARASERTATNTDPAND